MFESFDNRSLQNVLAVLAIADRSGAVTVSDVQTMVASRVTAGVPVGRLLVETIRVCSDCGEKMNGVSRVDGIFVQGCRCGYSTIVNVVGG